MRKSPYKLLRFLLLICFLPPWLSNAQKPTLGLVLSGGGAKGIAHVSVLKAMEEAGLKPDYITGTSMGAIIGGLYATGYSASQIEDIISEIDWELTLSNNIPLNYISYEEKEYYNRFLVDLPLRNGKVELPSGVIEGQMLSEVLNHYTWPAMKYAHFDSLPIPFRCVATDVSTGKEIVFEEGSLAEAMRASMAIPTAFSAADLDSTLAVDGGIVNNFPADILKDMGADVIIGVNVTRGFKPSDEVNSIAGILTQMSMLSSNEKLPERVALCDLYLQPYLEDFSTANFSKYEEIMEIGRVEAAQYKSSFDSIARIVGQSEKFKGIDMEESEIILSSISFKGNSLFNDDVVNGKLNLSPGDTVTPKEVEEGVRRVFGINGFYKVEYRLKQDKEGMDLRLKMTEKPPVTLRSSFHYDNTFSAGIVFNIQMRDLLLNSSRTILAADISENLRFRFDYYKYIGQKKRAAVNVRYNFRNEQIPIYEKGSKSDVQTNAENLLSVSILSTQSLKNSIFLGADFNSNRFKSEFHGIFPSGLDYGDFRYTKIKGGYFKNTLNNQNYPTNGTEILLEAAAYYKSSYQAKYLNPLDTLEFTPNYRLEEPLLFNEKEANEYLDQITPDLYGTFYFRNRNFIQFSKKFQLIPEVAVGLIASTDSSNAVFNEWAVGGFQQVNILDTRFMGLNYAEENLENFALAGLTLQNVILKNFFLRYGANALLYQGHIPINNPEDVDVRKIFKDQSIIGFGGELTYRSFIGPISLGITSNTRDGYVRYYFALGYSFNYRD